ncbi:hypothetical protein [Mesorhizobium waimense]|uniref:hypothetical protein n=1 Tax=Mesorhizobium waimense TaxID=1300307 RepID=UPI00142DE4D5|nr:hypothetical protein [Mesorhizobium waimense]
MIHPTGSGLTGFGPISAVSENVHEDRVSFTEKSFADSLSAALVGNGQFATAVHFA